MQEYRKGAGKSQAKMSHGDSFEERRTDISFRMDFAASPESEV